MVFEEEKIRVPKIKIKVIGLGGGGNSIVAQLSQKLKKVQFLCANTDLQALKRVKKYCKIFHFGEKITHGLGTGMDPQMGFLAAEKEREKIEKLFQGTDFAILISCLGGGTGSGALPVFLQAAKKEKVSLLGVFTLPFKFEGEKKFLIAKNALEKADPFLPAKLIISNEQIFNLLEKETPLQMALSKINQILGETLSSLIEIFSLPGFINIDFADLKSILKGKGNTAWLQTIESQGQERADKILKELFKDPLYEYQLKKPQRILFNITGGGDLKISEVNKIATFLWQKNPKAKIIFGVSQKANFGEKIKLVILAIGEGKEELKDFREKIQKQKESFPKIQKEKKKILIKKIFQRKKEIQEAEKEILEKEAKWDTPAFLRQKKLKYDF